MGVTTTTLNIQGMRCAGCVSHVEKSLQGLSGVEEARVNLATAQAVVRHDIKQAPLAALLGAVDKAGYSALVDDGHSKQVGQKSDADNLAVWRWRLIGGIVTAIAVMLIAMIFRSSQYAWSPWAQLALATPVQVILGWPFYKGAWRGLKHLRADMDVLVALGSSVAYVYSVVVTMGPAIWGGEVYFDTAAMILAFVSIGKFLEAKARHSAASAISSLMNLQPPEATIVRGNEQITVHADEVAVGDHLLVRPGERIAVDGTVVEGHSAIDQSMVTGESMPIDIGPHDKVFAGTINQTGAFTFAATATGKHTLLAHVVELVKQAQASKANVQRIADQVAGVFVPVVLLIALGALLGWGLLGYNWVFAMTTMVAVLIVACPCALGLATPTAIMVGTGIGAKHGLLIKDAAALERAGKLTVVVLDKTGTLTLGRPQVTDVVMASDIRGHSIDEDELLRLAGAVESRSEHPLGRAVVTEAQRRGLALPGVSRFQSTTAAGVRGDVEGKRIIVGRLTALRDAQVAGLDKLTARRDELLQAAKTAVGVAVDGQAVGIIAFADQIRPGAEQMVADLHKLGLRTVMMSGDNRQAAEAVASRLGIDQVLAPVLPAEKQERIKQLQADGAVVAMVGDGINDAAALAAADIGIAIGAATDGGSGGGGGSDIAMEAGHVVLVGGQLDNLPRAIRLSRATMQRIYVGLFWAFGYNMVLIPLAAAGIMKPMWAAAAMALSSVSVVLNALYLRYRWKG